MSNLIGHSLGRYHILEQLGEGGMAIVYKAYDTRLETDVAVKVIRTEKFTPEALVRTLKRFEDEAKDMARLTHPNIVKVTDFGEYENQPYLVMPLLAGGNLKQYLRERGRISWQEAVKLLLPIARALEFAHSQGIIHRDVKPANILLTQNGQPMLTDFGVAKVVEEEATVDTTGSGVGVGTPEYMAPEQASKNFDYRVDIFALGIVLYEMVTGRRPYEADTPLAVMMKQASEPLPRPIHFAPDLPKAVENVIVKALAKKPENRYQGMDAMIAALEGLTTVSSVNWKRYLQVGGPLVLICLIAGAILLERNKPANLQTSVLAPTRTQAVGETQMVSLTLEPSATITPFPTQESRSISPLDGMQLVYIPEGNFNMGSNNGDPDEQPTHTVYLDAYWIDQTEVTNAMYALCVQVGSCEQPKNISSSSRSIYYGKSLYADYPVIFVDWNDADTYCSWAGRRLPTEAEWEKAARGTDGSIYPWGNNYPTCDLANYNQCVGDTSAVGSYPGGASQFGVLDMGGNVWEWTADWYSETYYANSLSSDPKGPPSGQYRVARGGAWDNIDYRVRSVFRSNEKPDFSDFYFGFRCVQDIVP